nr:hypothetical protein [Tanacetum cinerariifolium]
MRGPVARHVVTCIPSVYSEATSVCSEVTSGIDALAYTRTGTDNYNMWSCAMKFALRNKSKLGFIDGTLKRKSNNPDHANQWDLCNSVVVTWILNSVSTELYSGQIYSKTAFDMWTDLKDTYDKVDGSFDAMISLPTCTCEAAKHYENHANQIKLMQFLMGLDNVYQPIRSNILTRDPLPFVKTTFAVVSGEEYHRNVTSGSASKAPSATAFGAKEQRNIRRSKQIVKPEFRTIVETPVANMADTRTMSKLLQAPTEGYGDAIVIPAILAENFELKVGLLSLVTSIQFHGFERDDPHSHIHWFNKITSTLKYKNVPHDAIKLMLFLFSLEVAARVWLEKEPPRFIHTWEDLVFKFVNFFFPHSKTMNLKNDITNYSLNAAAGGNILNRTPRDDLKIIENKSKVRTSRNKPVVSKVNTTTSSSSPSLDITALTDIIKELVLMNKANQQASVKATEETCVTCGGPHPYYECLATGGNTFDACAATGTYNQGDNHNYNQNRYNQNQGNNDYQAPNYQAQVGPSNELTNYMKSNEATLRAMQTQISNIKTELQNEFTSTIDTRTNKIESQNNQIMNILTNLTMQRQSPPVSGSLPSNTIANPRGARESITTRSGVAYDGPTIPPTPSPLPKELERETEAKKDKVQTTNPESTAHVQPSVVQVPNSELIVAPKPNLKSFADALLHMPKFASTFKSLLSNKEKLFKLASTLLNENYSAVLLKRLSEKLGDPVKFLIPCDFPKLEECLALSDLGASINLMPLSLWKKLSLPKLTPTRMTLELANRLVVYLVGVAKDVFVKVGKFYFSADFVVVDYDVDPRAITFKVWHTSRYFRNYYEESVNRIDVIDVSCEEYAQEVLGFSDSSTSGNPTPSDPIIASASPSFTPFEGSGFILEEIKTFLRTPDELSTMDDDFDPEREILL